MRLPITRRALATALLLGMAVSASPLLGHTVSHDGTVMLEYERRMIQGPDPGPKLVLFEDGFVWVHFPVFMKRAGAYGLQLTDEETNTLRLDLERWGVAHFNAEATSVELAREPKASTLIVPGAAWTVLRLYGNGSDAPSVHEIRWQGVRWSALAYPDHGALNGLAKAQERLEALLHDARLEPAEDQP